MEQLPSEVQKRIYTDFLFGGFCYHFAKFFTIEDSDQPRKHAYYKWNNSNYEAFVLHILRYLCPIKYKARSILLNELEESN